MRRKLPVKKYGSVANIGSCIYNTQFSTLKIIADMLHYDLIFFFRPYLVKHLSVTGRVFPKEKGGAIMSDDLKAVSFFFYMFQVTSVQREKICKINIVRSFYF